MIGASASSLLLLNDGLERNVFVTAQFCILIVAPIWKSMLRKCKEKVSGPWDIARVTVEE